MPKIKVGKNLKISKLTKFDFGYVVIVLFASLFIFLIGRSFGKREFFESKKRYTEEMNEALLNRRLMLLNQI